MIDNPECTTEELMAVIAEAHLQLGVLVQLVQHHLRNGV